MQKLLYFERLKMYLRVIICVYVLFSADAYKILVVYPCPIRSLSILGEGYVRHLLNAGHEVTYVTSYPIKNENKNLRQIDISSNIKAMNAEGSVNIKSVMDNEMPMNDVKMLQEYPLLIAASTFEDKNLRSLLEDENQRFDAVVIDLYESEVYSGISALYDCPLIWAYSMGAHWQPLRLIDEPTNPAYTTDYLSSNTLPLSFQQRVEELWRQINWSWIKWINTIPKENEIYKNYFGPIFEKRGKVLPEYNELIYNVSLILGNEHHALGNIPKTPQNFKFVGGYHIENPAKPLSKNLQTLMDNTKNGVIYFSMGSLWSSKDLPRVIIDGLLKIFGDLKETVLWKFEEDLPNTPPNVKIMKWAPQQSILAHPNCIMFITHGGLLSSTETIHFGVPIIGIPIFFDQFININKATSKGYAIRVPLDYNLPNNLKSAIQTMLKDSKYRNMAKELSAIYHDRPLPPGKEAVHWIEHVIRTRGAPHLGSPALKIPFYQKLYLDLAAIVMATLIIIWYIIKKMFSKLRSSKKEKVN